MSASMRGGEGYAHSVCRVCKTGDDGYSHHELCRQCNNHNNFKVDHALIAKEPTELCLHRVVCKHYKGGI